MKKKYKKHYCNSLVLHMKEGNSLDTFASYADTSIDTVHSWIDSEPAFAEAYEEAFPKYLLYWENKVKNLKSGENAQALKMYMANKFDWRLSDKGVGGEQTLKEQIVFGFTNEGNTQKDKNNLDTPTERDSSKG